MPFSFDEAGPTLIGYSDEPVMQYVLQHIPDRHKFTFIPLEAFEADDQAYARCDAGKLHLFASTIGAVSISAGTPVYGRVFNRSPVRNAFSVRRFIEEFTAWSENVPSGSLIINRPLSRGSLGSKFAHLEVLRSFGFSAPLAVLAQDPEELSSVAEPINKGVSGYRTEAARVDGGVIYNQRSPYELPALVQQYVPGVDVRLHLVGTTPFAVQIRSDADDYRYARKHGHDVSFETIKLPPDILDMCWQYARWAGLELAGFDFKVDGNGRYWVLECNGMPGFSYFDRQLGGAIVKELSKYLLGGFSHHHGGGSYGGTILQRDRVPQLRVGSAHRS